MSAEHTTLQTEAITLGPPERLPGPNGEPAETQPLGRDFVHPQYASGRIAVLMSELTGEMYPRFNIEFHDALPDEPYRHLLYLGAAATDTEIMAEDDVIKAKIDAAGRFNEVNMPSEYHWRPR